MSNSAVATGGEKATHPAAHRSLILPKPSHADKDFNDGDLPTLCALDDLVKNLGDGLRRIICHVLRVYLAISCASQVLISRSLIGSAGANFVLHLPPEAPYSRCILRLNPTAAPGLLGLPWEHQLLRYVRHAPLSHPDYSKFHTGVRVMRALYNFHHDQSLAPGHPRIRYPGLRNLLLHMRQYAERLGSAQNPLFLDNPDRQKIIRLILSHQLVQRPEEHQPCLDRWIAQAEGSHSRLVHAHLDVRVQQRVFLITGCIGRLGL